MTLTPLTQRRLANFRANRRGYYSMWVFLALFGLSLFAEFIANDKPIVLYLNDELHFPIFELVTETDLGGELPIEADYSDPYVKDLIEEGGGWAVHPPIPYAYDTIDLYIETAAPAAPSARHWLGTDDGAKDTLARLIYGFRLSVLFGLTLTAISSVIGVSVGALQGYFGGKVDLVGQRIVEIWAGLPILLILIILTSVIEPNVFWLLAILACFSWMALVSVVRAEFLRARNFDYVRAARSLGVSNFTIMRRHVLPNAMVATLTYLPFLLSGAVTTLTALDFLGFGLPAGSPSLGELLTQGKNNLHAPWLGLTGFFTMAILLTLLIFVGEAVRDAFDPRRVMKDPLAV
ncbi:MAG: ABC transporter permease [Gammaproteobacteria bacterium]|nr:ABC transporter permease [Gammaproteobacteria bacterium]MYE23219.1 ABC transporter permease [Gammaproteobacteria bacterium]